MRISGEYLVSELARMLEISEKTCRKYLHGVKPARQQNRRKFYKVTQAIEVIPANLLGLQESRTGGVAEARARLIEAQAATAELGLQERRDELVNAEEMGQKWLDLILVCRSRLLAIPPKLAIQLVGRTAIEIKAALKDEIYQALTELSEYKPEEWDNLYSNANDGDTQAAD